MKTKLLTLGLLACLLLFAGCGMPVSGAQPSETSPVDAVATEAVAAGTVVAETESSIVVEEDKGIGMANPASVYCGEQGGALDIRDTDVGQYGVCIFPDGSECEEWAFFKGECAPGGSAPKLVFGWYGRVITPPAGQPFENYLMLSPKEAGNAGLTTSDPAVKVQLDALRDTDKLAHFWGALICENTGFDKETEFGGCVLGVTRLRVDSPGDFFAPDPVEGWAGVLVSLSSEPGSGGDDAFILEDPVFRVRYGLHAFDPAVAAQLDNLRDRNVRFYVWGELTCGVPDAGGCQIVAMRIEDSEDIAPGTEAEPPVEIEVITEPVENWVGVVVSNPEGAQFDDYFQMLDQNGTRVGITGFDAIGEQLVALRDTGTMIHVWGGIRYNVPDAYGSQIEVTRLEVE